MQIKELLGCDKVICLGDAMNDIHMYKIAEEKYAVANAVAELKALATDIIRRNNEDGVATWLLGYYSDVIDS